MDLTSSISLFISIFAFLFSITATLITLQRRKSINNRSMRIELTKILNEITDVILENEKLKIDLKDNISHFQNVSVMLNQKNMSLLFQAKFLIEKIPNLTLPMDYNILAYSAFNANDYSLSKRYFEKNISITKQDLYKAQALRGYGEFLFCNSEPEKGREKYTEALTLIQGDNDIDRSFRGETYQRWGNNELTFSNSTVRYTELLNNATIEFKGIRNTARRDVYQKGIQNQRTFPNADI